MIHLGDLQMIHLGDLQMIHLGDLQMIHLGDLQMVHLEALGSPTESKPDFGPILTSFGIPLESEVSLWDHLGLLWDVVGEPGRASEGHGGPKLYTKTPDQPPKRPLCYNMRYFISPIWG